MAKTVVGLMDSFDAACRAIDELVRSGFERGDMSLISNDGQATAANDSGEDPGLIASLMREGVPEEDAHRYADGVRRGGALVTARAGNDEQAGRAVAAMRRHGAVDLDRVLTPKEAALAREGSSGGARVYSAEGVPQVEAIVALEEEDVLAAAPPPVEAPKAAKRSRKNARKAAGSYAGPERRVSNRPYGGVERRKAA